MNYKWISAARAVEAMTYARQMLDTYPHQSPIDAGVLTAAIDALSDCVQACTADVDADLSESDLADMVKCIRRAWTAQTFARPLSGFSAARPNLMPTSPSRWLRPAWRSARAAEMSASGTPAARALPGVRGVLPALRKSLPRTPGRHCSGGCADISRLAERAFPYWATCLNERRVIFAS